ncbi:MAG: phospholipid carrier-dependent glycosyltransferase, partial [Pseudomonas sp.]|uniref:phospholipid carrier-dependent glycosyltransferase n=1 Tax=Pseudomonas sp. TaxID=306 RepID=UPI0012188B38
AIFGENLFGVRIVSALSSGLSVVLAYWLAARMWNDPRKSFASALLFMSFAFIAGQAGYANLDPQFTLWSNLTLVGFWCAVHRSGRARLGAWTLIGLACGIGFMTKGFLAWALPVMITLPYMLWQRRLGELLRYGPLAVLIAIVVSLPWVLSVHVEEPDFWRFFFWHEHVRRFAGADAQHAEPWWFYLPLLVVSCLPWAALLPVTFRQAWQRRRRPDIGFLLLWLLVPAAGLIGLGVLLWLQLQQPVYVHEPLNLLLAIIVLIGWCASNALQGLRPMKFWAAPALGSWLLVALLPAALPYDVVHNKTPDQFVLAHQAQLAASTHLLSNDLGAASALAWRLNRTDVSFFNTWNELDYGLGYPDVTGREVTLKGIDEWMTQARREGQVGVVMRGRSDEELRELELLPKDAERYDEGNLIILIYGKSAP